MVIADAVGTRQLDAPQYPAAFPLSQFNKPYTYPLRRKMFIDFSHHRAWEGRLLWPKIVPFQPQRVVLAIV